MIQIQLDASALAELFEKDQEARFCIRQAVVNVFAKKYLKGVLDQETQKELRTKLINEWKIELSQYVDTHIKNWLEEKDGDCKVGIFLRERLQKKIDGIFATTFAQAIQKATDKVMVDLEKRVAVLIENRANELISNKLRLALEEVKKSLLSK